MSAYLRGVLELTAVRIGANRIPLLPFAITTAALLLLLPPADTPYWGLLTLAGVFFLAVAIDAFMRDMVPLAGIPAGLIAGFTIWQPLPRVPLPGLPMLACLLLVAFAVSGAWRVVAYGVGTAVATIVVSLLVVPPEDFRSMATQQRFLSGVYATGLHNISLTGFIANVLAIVEHTGTTTYVTGAHLASLLNLAVVGVAALVVAAVAISVWRAGQGSTADREVFWPTLACLVTLPVLAPMLVWPTESLLIVVGTLLLLGWSLSTSLSRIWSSPATLGGILVICLFVAATLSGSDWRYLPQGTIAPAFYLLWPLAAILLWVSALWALIGAFTRNVRQPGKAGLGSKMGEAANASATA
jgi:hypothetical protein